MDIALFTHLVITLLPDKELLIGNVAIAFCKVFR